MPANDSSSHGRSFLLVALGGALGTALRHLLGDWIGTAGDFPIGTFLINIVGALLLGFLLERVLRQDLRLLLGTGFLGGFTTYSALAVDTDLLIRGEHLTLAAAYGIGTIAVGLVASIVGMALGRRTTS